MSNHTTEGVISDAHNTSYLTKPEAFAFLDGIMTGGDDMLEEIGVLPLEDGTFAPLFYDYGADEGSYDEMPEGVITREQYDAERDEGRPKCPRCSLPLYGDTSKKPHNDEGQPYCSGTCFDNDMRSAGKGRDEDAE